MAPVLLRTTLAVLVALLGALLGVSLSKASARSRLPLLLFGASGVLLAVVVCDVMPEAKAVLSWPAFLLAGGSGWAAFYLVNRYIYPVCPSCAFGEFSRSSGEKLRQTATFLLLALGLHSTLDGMAVVVGDEIMRHANTGLLLAVTFHKLPEGFALAILLLAAGYSRNKTLAWTTLVELGTVAGGFLAVWLLRDASPAFLGVLLAHVGGGFLFLVVNALRHHPFVSAPTVSAQTSPVPSRLPLLVVGGAAFVITAGLLFLIHTLVS